MIASSYSMIPFSLANLHLRRQWLLGLKGCMGDIPSIGHIQLLGTQIPVPIPLALTFSELITSINWCRFQAECLEIMYLIA
jgi:hypothetical protein